MANFSDTIESVHHRVAADEWDRIFIVGDPHGCRAELETLCEKLEISETDLVILSVIWSAKDPIARVSSTSFGTRRIC